MTAIAATIQAFFTDRLIAQRRASPHTITAYRDTLRLLLGFAAQQHRLYRWPISPTWTRPAISAFLDHLERERGRSSSPPPWLAAIHSLFGFAALRATPSTLLTSPGFQRAAQRRSAGSAPVPHPVLRPRPPLAAPDRATRTGRRAPCLDAARGRDRAAGLRAHRPDLPLDTVPSRRRRLRRLPRQRPGSTGSRRLARAPSPPCGTWLAEHAGHQYDPLFTTIRGGPMSRTPSSSGATLYATVAGMRRPSPGQQPRHPGRPGALAVICTAFSGQVTTKSGVCRGSRLTSIR